MPNNIKEKSCFSLLPICYKLSKSIFKSTPVIINKILKTMMNKHIINIFLLRNTIHEMSLLAIVSKALVLILMIPNKRVHLKILSFQNICKLNYLPISNLIKLQGLSIVKKLLIQLFHQVTPKENIV